MRRCCTLLFVCCVGLASAGAPPGVWFGRSSAMILVPSGATRIDVTWGAAARSARLARVVTSRLEVAGSWSMDGALGLEGKVVLVGSLVPLIVAATLGTDGIGVVSTLFFGPVRIDGGRTWGAAPCRWATVQLSARPEISMVLGVGVGRAAAQPFAGVRLFPAGHALWEIDVSVARRGVRLSVGGVAW